MSDDDKRIGQLLGNFMNACDELFQCGGKVLQELLNSEEDFSASVQIFKCDGMEIDSQRQENIIHFLKTESQARHSKQYAAAQAQKEKREQQKKEAAEMSEKLKQRKQGDTAEAEKREQQKKEAAEMSEKLKQRKQGDTAEAKKQTEPSSKETQAQKEKREQQKKEAAEMSEKLKQRKQGDTAEAEKQTEPPAEKKDEQTAEVPEKTQKYITNEEQKEATSLELSDEPEKEKQEETSVGESDAESVVNEAETKPDEVKTSEKRSKSVPDDNAEQNRLRKERHLQELEKIRQEHQIKILEATEKAKNPEEYEDYATESAVFDPSIRVFRARRVGRGHLMGKITPCQDACLTAQTEKGMILVDADGVGSCAHSDIGSRLACEVTTACIQEADGKSETEQAFIELIQSERFRRMLVMKWVKEVLSHARENGLANKNEQEVLKLFGSTLLFAVITKNWIVTGNLGDGQILLFNDREGVKLRIHSAKESTKTPALVNPNCAAEDFQMAVYSRKYFNGVLLSTDGMYDILCRGDMLYQYAMAIKSRFLEKGAPYQPFCFQEEGEGLKDLSRFRTKDDCSIVLAVSDRVCQSGMDELKELFEEKEVEKSILWRQYNELWQYKLLMQDGSQRMAFVYSRSSTEKLRCSQLPKGVRYADSVDGWETEHYKVLFFDTENYDSLETLYHCQRLRNQKTLTQNRQIIELYEALVRCHKKLAEQGFSFSSEAHMLVLADMKTAELVLLPNALKPLEGDAVMSKAVFGLFANLMGFLSQGQQKHPVFTTGFSQKGRAIPFFERDERQPLCAVFNGGRLGSQLVNISTVPWKLEDGSVVKAGEKTSLKDGLTLTLCTADSGENVCYQYHAKEVL